MKNVYKLFYQWYDGDSGESYIATDLDEAGFINLLREASSFVNSFSREDAYSLLSKEELYEKKLFSVRCLPEYFEHLIRFLEKNGCEKVKLVKYFSFAAEDDFDRNFRMEKDYSESHRDPIL